MKTTFPFTLITEVPDDTVRAMLCNAFEGGSNAWYWIEAKVLPPGDKVADYCEGGKYQDPKNYWHWAQLLPTVECGALIIRAPGDSGLKQDIEGSDDVREDDMFPTYLDREAIRRGLRVMQEKYPQHFANMMSENDDADTGDCLLQCCCFGEMIFG